MDKNMVCRCQQCVFFQKSKRFFLLELDNPSSSLCKYATHKITKVLHMCFDRFPLAFESCDLSQADKNIKGVFSFPIWVMSSKSYFSVSQAWGLNFLKTKFCQSSQIYLSLEKKTEKTVYFLSLETFEW